MNDWLRRLLCRHYVRHGFIILTEEPVDFELVAWLCVSCGQLSFEAREREWQPSLAKQEEQA